jgi:hypothetical protein
MSPESPSGSKRFVHGTRDLDSDELDTPSERKILPDRTPDGVRRRSYDKAFEAAVAEGLLTVQAAWARGSREAYAVGLQCRYQLSNALALKVADNRVSLIDALEILDRQTAGALPEWTDTRGRFRWQLLTIAVVIAGILLLWGRYGEQLWEDESRNARDIEQLSFAAASQPPAVSVGQEQEESSAAGLMVRRDEFGRVTQISAGRPIAVLEEVCRLASLSGSCERMEMRHTEPRYPGHRIGRFAAAHGDGEFWVVRIRLNRSSGRWFVGTGLRPLEPVPDGGRGLRAP